MSGSAGLGLAWAPSGRTTVSVTLMGTRTQSVNLPSASTSANNTQRNYRGEWHWTYRLFRGLTATQRNDNRPPG